MQSAPNEPLVEQFVRTFEEASRAQISPDRQVEVPFKRSGATRHLDLLLIVEGQEEVHFAVEVIRQGYPRDVRDAVWQLDEYRLACGRDVRVVPLVLAEQLSPGARESLRERNVAYFDASGSLFLNHGKWLINIERPPKPQPQRRVGSIFTGAREQVVHALLRTDQDWLTGLELAHSAETSPYTVSLTLQELERLEWVESQGAGRRLRRRLVQPGRLLDAWSEVWRKRRESRSRWYAYASNPLNLLPALTTKLAGTDLAGWAFTGAAAANLVAPLLTSIDTAELMIPPGLTGRYAEALGLKEADKGSNVILIERSGTSTLFRRRQLDDRCWLASPFVQYLDLQDGRGRNKELAAHLRETVLKI
jgi:hypothetical protein